MDHDQMNAAFSIIICAYNPEPTIFERLLNALENIKKQSNCPEHELIIVDNNSVPALSERILLKNFMDKFPDVKLVVEKKAGLTSARIGGARHATGEWIVFFDDDNEPAADYLIKASGLIRDYPQTGVWGPGKITVEFMGEVSAFARSHKDLFQERDMPGTVIDNVRWGQTAYPYGTGMLVRKQILDAYVAKVAEGAYTMSDRIGKSLISGGDMQILLTGIRMGWYAGSSPLLQLNHLIRQQKTSYKKMLQLVYMLSASAVKLYNEVFPEQPHSVVPITNKYVLKTLYTQTRLHLFKKPLREAGYLTATRMGELYAHIIAANKQKTPFMLRMFYKIIS